MALNIWEKIEEVRRQPEPVRMRYALICLAISMLFVIGIWMLSVNESFHSVSRDVPQAVEKGKGLVPGGVAPAPSLGDMLKEASPLRVDNSEKTTGDQFFQDQVKARGDTSLQEGIPNVQQR
jgi:hypothetical protein